MSGADFLDIDGAREELARVGIPASRHQVERWAVERRLPFFRLGRKLWIARSELHRALQQRQLAALRGDDRRGRRRRVA